MSDDGMQRLRHPDCRFCDEMERLMGGVKADRDQVRARLDKLEGRDGKQDTEGTTLVPAIEALDICARAMADPSAFAPPTDPVAAREDVRALFTAAGQIQAASIATPHVQSDDRVPLPNWLVNP